MSASPLSNLFLQFFWSIHMFRSLVVNIFLFRFIFLKNLCLTDISGFRKLEILDLSYNRLSGTIPLYLKNLSQLSALYLSGNMLNGTFDLQGNNLNAPMQLFLYYENIDILSMIGYILSS